MRQTFRDSRIAVFDDVLPGSQYDELWRFVQRLPYRPILHNQYVASMWEAVDGIPRMGPTFLLPAVPREELLPGTKLEELGKAFVHPVLQQDMRFYPTGELVDAPLSALERVAREAPDLVGEAGKDWRLVTADTYAYTVGSGLSWHRDSFNYSGSFVFYTHPEWDPQWGGELLVLDPSRPAEDAWGALEKEGLLQFDSRRRAAALLELGMGRFVVPKPNRLVLLSREAIHMLAHVKPAAGNHVRTSIAGFLVRPGVTLTRVLLGRDAV